MHQYHLKKGVHGLLVIRLVGRGFYSTSVPFRFVTDIVRKLSSYARVLAKGTNVTGETDVASWRSLASEGVQNLDCKQVQLQSLYAERVLLLMVNVLDSCHGVNMPVLRPHLAEAEGYEVELNVAVNSSLHGSGFETSVFQDNDFFKVLEISQMGVIYLRAHSNLVRFWPIEKTPSEPADGRLV
jgi:hypothetical protein